MEIAALRQEYAKAGLDRSELDPDPLRQFALWFEINLRDPSGEPNAMTLATVGRDGAPSSRTVLLKGFDAEGFRFFTNYASRKARQIEENPRVSLTFHWYGQERQVNIEGRATRTSREISKRISIRGRAAAALARCSRRRARWCRTARTWKRAWREMEARYGSEDPPLPEYWGGYSVVPTRYEFWQGRPSRLHDRFQYRPDESGGWIIERLAP